MSSHTKLLRMITNGTIRNAFILFILFIIPAAILHAQSNKKLNVLLIAVDDLNDWVGAFKGYPGVHTPNFDRLAKMGMRFTKAYCAAPACNPSRTALLTGVRPSSSGVYHNNQPWRPALPQAITLPQYFTANGYEVMGIGKIFHGPYDDSASWPKSYKNNSFPDLIRPHRAVMVISTGDPWLFVMRTLAITNMCKKELNLSGRITKDHFSLHLG